MSDGIIFDYHLQDIKTVASATDLLVLLRLNLSPNSTVSDYQETPIFCDILRQTGDETDGCRLDE